MRDSNSVLTANFHFEVQKHGATSLETVHVSVSYTSKMTAKNRKWIRKKYIFACIDDSNDIPTAILIFSGSGNTTGPVRLLSNVKVSGESKKATINRKFIRYNVYLSLYV